MDEALRILKLFVDGGPPLYSHLETTNCTYCGCLTFYRPDEGIPMSKPHAEDCPWRIAEKYLKENMGQKASTQEVLTALAEERERDVDGLKGAIFSIPGWIELMRSDLNWEVGTPVGVDDGVWLVRALVTGIACLEQHGLPNFLKGEGGSND